MSYFPMAIYPLSLPIQRVNICDNPISFSYSYKESTILGKAVEVLVYGANPIIPLAN